MRPYGREQLESLYFEYPKFRAPKFNKNKEEAVDVTIVGAGPIGLTAALTLAKYGVSSVILEAKDTFNDGSRAICIARQSFHIFDTLGVINQFTKKALGWTKGRSFYRGKQILEFDMPDSENQKYRPMYNLEQQYIGLLYTSDAADDSLRVNLGEQRLITKKTTNKTTKDYE